MEIIFALVMLFGGYSAAEKTELCINRDRATLTQAEVAECESYSDLHENGAGWNMNHGIGLDPGLVINW